jgi:hypothetical protein
MSLGEVIREYYEDLADELVRLRDQREKATRHDAEAEARIANLERLFSGTDDELEDLDADGGLDFDRGYYTGDPVADEWERQWQRTGRIPDME